MNRRASPERENGPWGAEQSDYYFLPTFSENQSDYNFLPVTNFIWSLFFRRAFSRNYTIPSRSARPKLVKQNDNPISRLSNRVLVGILTSLQHFI